MIEFSILDAHQVEAEKATLVDWLYDQMGEYRDEPDAIARALDYAVSTAEGKGGLVVVGRDHGRLSACSVVNNTGMSGYIPEHQLVFISVDRQRRGQGLGRALLQFTVDHCPGAMALHVEYDNPARFLYRKLGFTSHYAEMRRPAESADG